jgi:T5SS/PEP-CTERM-associated repeat protein
MATVTGAGSTWTNNSALFVGSSGNGTLNIEAGAQVNTGGGTLGYNPGSTGMATVTGAGSKWTSGLLSVGFNGIGSLTVSGGGEVVTETLRASLSDLHGDGTITATGAVLDADMVFDAAHGSSQSFAFVSCCTL